MCFVLTGLLIYTDRLHQFSIVAVLIDDVIIGIGQPDIVVMVNIQSMGIRELVIPKGRKDFTGITINAEHRASGTVKNKDTVVLIYFYTGSLTKGITFRQDRPAMDNTIVVHACIRVISRMINCDIASQSNQNTE